MSIVYFLLAVALFILSFFYLELKTFGFSSHSVQISILGSEAAFVPPMPFEELLLNIHIKLFFFTFLTIMITALLLRVNTLSIRCKTYFNHISYGLVFLDSLSLIGVRYLFKDLALVKTISFTALMALHMIALIYLLAYLWPPALFKKKAAHS